MTDRELLGLAAKAAGYTIHFDDFACNSRETEYWVDELCEGRGGYWNPLNDDGDAFRLAVKLGLVVAVMNEKDHPFTAVYTYSSPARADVFHESAADAAATRRAIVRVAAALGSPVTPTILPASTAEK